MVLSDPLVTHLNLMATPQTEGGKKQPTRVQNKKRHLLFIWAMSNGTNFIFAKLQAVTTYHGNWTSFAGQMSCAV